ncbi:XRE family transcriptional regulator [Clostridium sp. AF19-22AC]|jgi:transcriptional regulator with XRE-family HTH domain|uniref:DNA-binding XRE family transcriptional regulator n=1 Tax=Faecalicatena orotica TaxID=1544 RepID=A0A2Y9BBT5_9FIRM|nr:MULTISPECIES: helix-turn-helix transcriptional regulator [Clostridia]PWJ31863.1 DNA-binding XRE family transcriptional regulator [Faecalicatena orotica]RHR32390.1 XRE family transcriptional regulator [Clostridium sp. AF19-22AC]SSA53689.1 DNA-binding transcriptional regulator, XRE-family HTH domain [Faecalicatena orotica]
MKKNINVGIGKRIRSQREYMHLTREQFAEMIEISPQFLADIESGKKGMSFTTLQKLCSSLGVSCDYIVLGKTADSDTSNLKEMINNIDAEYLPLAEELLKTFIKTIAKAEHK